MADMTGKTLGKYRIVERLGRGGMAEVYKAYQPGLDRYVAIKLMHGYLAEDPDFVGRFQREAKAIAALHHPHIVQVHDFDIESDVYYMVQEYVEGGTLKARLQEARSTKQPITIQETVRILSAICDAVDYAHQQGRVHRDIKPDNIMFDARDRPVLTDFGIASIVGGTRFTATGAMVGTPAYMSPEQGKGYPGDERSDVYSLGVVLYEMVTGRIPFDADTPFAVVLKHVNEPLPMPRTLNPDVPYSIERVILKALAKDPADRYQRASDLSHALQDMLEEETSPAWETPPIIEQAMQAVTPPPSIQKPGTEIALPVEPPIAAIPPDAMTPPPVEAVGVDTAKTSEKKKRPAWLWIVGAVAGVALLFCCTLGGLNMLKRIREQRALKEGTVVVTPGAAALTPTSKDLTRQAVSAAPEPVGQVQALIDQGFEMLGDECLGDLDRALALFEQALAQDANAARAHAGQAFSQFCQGYNNPALDSANRAIELAPDDPLGYYVRGRIQADQEKAEEAVADFSAAIERDPGFARAYYRRALLYVWPLEAYDEAFADLNQAIALAPEMSVAYLERGNLHLWHKQDPQAALADFNRFIELEPDNPQGYAERAVVYENLQDYAQAAVELTLALERAPEEDKPAYYFNRGRDYQFSGQLDKAIDDYDQSIAQSPDVEAYFWRGMAYYQTENNEAALADFDQVLLLGWEGREGAAHHAKGWIFARQGNFEQAIAAYDQAIEYDFDDYAWPFFIDTHPLLDRARAYRALEQYERALDDLNALIEDEGYDGWALAYLERALTYRAMGQRLKAVQDLRQAWELADRQELRDEIERLLAETQEGGQPQEPTTVDCRSADVFCVGMVSTETGINDYGFNYYTWQGVLQAEAELGAVVSYSEPADASQFVAHITEFAEAGYDVIVTVGWTQYEATHIVAAAYGTDSVYIAVDQYQAAEEYLANVVGLIFPEDQAGFLAGALASMMSKTGIIGAVLGPDTVPPVWRYGEGFYEGAAYIDPDIDVLMAYYDGDISQAFVDPDWGYDVAVEMIQEDADVIFAAAGPTGVGALRACVDEDVYAIGVDVDQYDTVPEAQGVLLTSAIKDLGPSIFELIRLAYEGQFPGDSNYVGRVGLAPFHVLEDEVPDEYVERLAEIVRQLHEGSLSTNVPTAKPGE
ncbi:MAG: BMP family ABC transporter substrate-binding protein [Anaerolineae bacterium]|nr:BMP family ABC transporter substrate-binding protein [Anaerolineae bacterium]